MATKTSHHHKDWNLEADRLIRQFDREWTWEAQGLKDLGLRPRPHGTHPRNALVYGCGPGIDAFTLREEGFADYVEGWDGNESFISFARDRYGHLDRLKYQTIDVLEDRNQVEGKKFDLIYMRLMLQHVKTEMVDELFQYLATLLSDNGKIAVHDVVRDAYRIIPETHPFSDIDNEVCDYLRYMENDPSIGTYVPQILTRIGFRKLKVKIVTHLAKHDATEQELEFVRNVHDERRTARGESDTMLIPAKQWEDACRTKTPNFARVVVRTLTVAERDDKSK